MNAFYGRSVFKNDLKKKKIGWAIWEKKNGGKQFKLGRKKYQEMKNEPLVYLNIVWGGTVIFLLIRNLDFWF